MKKKLQNIINFLYRYSVVFAILVLWQMLTYFGILPEFAFSSPLSAGKAFADDFSLMMNHTLYTFVEMIIGIVIAIFLAFVLSIIMDWSKLCYEIFYPPIIITQTIPSFAIAPLLVVWLGYGMEPKIVLVIMTVFFPILIALLDGYRSVDADSIKLLQSMGATKWQTYWHVKFPASINYFFAGLRVSISYSLIAAVVAEWLGGNQGLGVYMTRVRKAYAIDKIFATIFFIAILSLVLMAMVDYIHRKVVKYEERK